MEEKYYEIIVKLVKNHRKYPGLEAILEDIVADVHERAKIVMNNVSNSEVVETYLAKIVSSSIITVPKKLNFNTNINHKVITTNSTTLSPRILESKTEVKENIEQENNMLEELVEEPIKSENEIILEQKSQDNVDISLVDKMINGVDSSKENDNLFIEETTFEMEETALDFEDLDNIEIIEETEYNSTETNDIVIEDTTESIIDEAEAIVEEADEIETIDVVEDQEEFLLDETETIVEDAEEIETLDIVEEQEEFLLDEAEAIIEEIDEIETIDVVEDQEEFLLENNDTSVKAELVTENNSMTSPNYQVFNYEPEELAFDKEYIETAIIDLSKKKPDAKIIDIIDLKYNKNHSVEEIATTLNLDVTFVVEVLSDVIDTIKD